MSFSSLDSCASYTGDTQAVYELAFAMSAGVHFGSGSGSDIKANRDPDAKTCTLNVISDSETNTNANPDHVMT